MEPSELTPFTEDCWMAAALDGKACYAPRAVARQTPDGRRALAARVLEAVPEATRKAALAEAEALGITILTPAHPAYPPALLASADAPPMLYVKGDVALLSAPQIAVVGPRRMTRLGAADAQRFAGDLTRAGWVVTSGLALGIDGVAHRAALAAGGATIAVLGSGLEAIYPAAHRPLAAAIAARGALVSEFPPFMSARPFHFPARNRIVSALSQGVLVIEAGDRSGALITARLAAEQGREVFVIPRHALDPAGAGGHRLLREGATLVRHLEDMLEELNSGGLPLQGDLDLSPEAQDTSSERKLKSEAKATDYSPPASTADAPLDSKVMQLLQMRSPWSLDELTKALENPPPGALAAALTRLELARRIRLGGTEVHWLR